MTDTQPPTLPPPSPSDAARPAPVRLPAVWVQRTGIAVVIVALAVLLVVSVLSLVPSSVVADERNERLDVDQPAPYARVPATATPVDDLIIIGDIENVTQYPPTGDIYFVTVSEPEQSALSWLVGRNSPAIQLTEEDKYGFQTVEQRQVFALESMATAEQVAQYVALSRLGFDAEIVPGDVLIQEIVCLEPSEDGSECVTSSPSDEVLDPGDRIIEVDGEPVESVEQLTAALDGYKPGDTVPMLIDRPDEGELTVDVELTASPDDPDRTIVGFYPFETAVELPFELDIDTGRIGGPSAGLAFTLTLIDDLSEGELTGGANIAVTGTISLDGTVGAIGGLRQKTSAVMQNGVDVFLVPATQSEADFEAAAEVAGDDLTIIPVASLDEALAALRDLGGDPLPLADSQPATSD